MIPRRLRSDLFSSTNVWRTLTGCGGPLRVGGTREVTTKMKDRFAADAPSPTKIHRMCVVEEVIPRAAPKPDFQNLVALALSDVEKTNRAPTTWPWTCGAAVLPDGLFDFSCSNRDESYRLRWHPSSLLSRLTLASLRIEKDASTFIVTIHAPGQDGTFSQHCGWLAQVQTRGICG